MKSQFLKSAPSIVIMSLLLIGCKKSSDHSVNYVSLHVLEFKTNTSIADASVTLYKCIKPGFGGCSNDSIIGTLTTDKNGSFQFDSKLDAYLIKASHSKYFDGTAGGFATGLGDIYLIPVAYTKIHLRKINVHAQDLLLNINLDQDPAPLPSSGFENSFDQVDDSTIIMKSFGNNNNTIAWYFTDKAGTQVTTEPGGVIPDYFINRFDTASIEINY